VTVSIARSGAGKKPIVQSSAFNLAANSLSQVWPRRCEDYINRMRMFRQSGKRKRGCDCRHCGDCGSEESGLAEAAGSGIDADDDMAVHSLEDAAEQDVHA
jgi:hypothetical protein